VSKMTMTWEAWTTAGVVWMPSLAHDQKPSSLEEEQEEAWMTKPVAVEKT
jgi:hypothetical protein